MTQQLTEQVGIDQCSFVRESNDIYTFPCGLEVNKTMAVGYPEEQWPEVKSAHQRHHWICAEIFGAGYHGAHWTFQSTVEANQRGEYTERIICPE